jgi:two-component system phosphate regulon sensor histidine kinase PhoR
MEYEVPMHESFTLGQAVNTREAVYSLDHLPRPGMRESGVGTIKRAMELLGSAPHIAAPLIAREHVIGAIAVQSKQLTEDDRSLVMAFAHQVALAIDNLRRDRQASERERQLSIIVQINQTVSADLNVSRAYEAMLPGIRRLVSFDRADLALVDVAAGRVHILPPGAAPQMQSAGLASYPLSGSMVEWIMTYGQPYVCKDTYKEQGFSEVRRAMSDQLRSCIAVPLRHRGNIQGAFILNSQTPYFYSEADCNVLAPIVDQMAIALGNFRLFDQVERDRQHLQAVLDSTGDAVVAIDAAGRVTLINPAAERLFKVAAAQAAGQPVSQVILLPALADAFRQALDGKYDVSTGIEIPSQANQTLFADLSPIRDPRASVLGWMAVIRDITHFKRLDALRSEAIATVAHDLKNPLHLASGALSVLAEDAMTLSEDQLTALGIAQTGLRRMKILIDDLLDLKKIEDGFGVSKRPCQLETILRSVVDEALAAAAARSQQLSLQVATALPVIQADPDRLHQVFANLVGNAIKYTQPGGEISVRVSENGPQVRAVVVDNGPGVSVEDQAHIFERFYRTRSASSVEGTGMGLAIVKSIVEQHGGQIVVQSGLGLGTRFIVSLPISGRQEPAA